MSLCRLLIKPLLLLLLSHPAAPQGPAPQGQMSTSLILAVVVSTIASGIALICAGVILSKRLLQFCVQSVPSTFHRLWAQLDSLMLPDVTDKRNRSSFHECWFKCPPLPVCWMMKGATGKIWVHKTLFLLQALVWGHALLSLAVNVAEISW